MPITEAEFTAAYTQRFDFTRACLRKRIGNSRYDEQLDDMLQTAWMKTWDYRDRFNGSCSIATFVNTISWNVFLTEMRRFENKDGAVVQLDTSEHRQFGHDALPSTSAAIYVRELLPHCTDTQRAAIELFYLQGCSCEEAAAVLDTHRDAVKLHLYRARRHMRIASKPGRRRKPKRLPPLVTRAVS